MSLPLLDCFDLSHLQPNPPFVTTRPVSLISCQAKSFFLLLIGGIWSNWLVSTFLYLANSPQMCFGERPIFPSFRMCTLELLLSSHDHYLFIFNIVHWAQSQFASFYHMIYYKYETHIFAIMTYNKSTGLQLTYIVWVWKKVPSKIWCISYFT